MAVLSAKEMLAMVRAQEARKSLHAFTRQAWHVVEPAAPFQDTWHIAAICAHLEAATRGEIRNLVINMPPRCGKSTIVSVMWPVSITGRKCTSVVMKSPAIVHR